MPVMEFFVGHYLSRLKLHTPRRFAASRDFHVTPILSISRRLAIAAMRHYRRRRSSDI